MKLIKKLTNLSLAIVLCLGCFGLVACDKSNDDHSPSNTTLTLTQVTQICNQMFEDFENAKSSTPIATSSASSSMVDGQISPAGISYNDYTSYISSNTYAVAEGLIDKVETKYELFKSNVLKLHKTYEYKVLGDNESEDFYIYLRVSSADASQILLEWAQTKDIKSDTYSDSLLYQSILINVDNSLNWSSVELKEFSQSNYGSEDVNASYYYIEKATSNTRKYDKYTSANTDYQYLDVNNIIGKSITLDCSHPTVLTQNQIKAKNYINSLELTNGEKMLEIFKQDAQYMGQFNASHI